MRVCLFKLRGERLAIPVEAVEEVFPLGKMIPVPGAPPWVIGAASRRGRVLPVLDPSLETAPTKLAPGQPLLALRVGDLLAAIPIDAAHGIREGEPDPDDEAKVVCDAQRWTLVFPARLARRWREAITRWATPDDPRAPEGAG